MANNERQPNQVVKQTYGKQGLVITQEIISGEHGTYAAKFLKGPGVYPRRVVALSQLSSARVSSNVK